MAEKYQADTSSEEEEEEEEEEEHVTNTEFLNMVKGEFVSLLSWHY